MVKVKGQNTGYPVAVAVQFLDSLGAHKVVLQSDGERSLIKHCAAVKAQRLSSAFLRTPPKASHQNNGGVERANQTLGGWIRTNKMQVEKAYGIEITEDH